MARLHQSWRSKRRGRTYVVEGDAVALELGVLGHVRLHTRPVRKHPRVDPELPPSSLLFISCPARRITLRKRWATGRDASRTAPGGADRQTIRFQGKFRHTVCLSLLSSYFPTVPGVLGGKFPCRTLTDTENRRISQQRSHPDARLPSCTGAAQTPLPLALPLIQHQSTRKG